jgi:hypothetical protein
MRSVLLSLKFTCLFKEIIIRNGIYALFLDAAINFERSWLWTTNEAIKKRNNRQQDERLSVLCNECTIPFKERIVNEFFIFQ